MSAKSLEQLDRVLEGQTIDKSPKNWRTRLEKPPQLDFSNDPGPLESTVVTNKGTLTIRLMPDVAPMHVSSWAYLVRTGFYDGLSFHRVIPQFMAQGGCPLGTGTGEPGYRIDGEYDPKVRHDRPGLLSAANTGQPCTDGSQFFLTFVPTPWLDGKHTIYGEVVEGADVLKELEKSGTQSGMTTEPLHMESVSLEYGS